MSATWDSGFHQLIGYRQVEWTREQVVLELEIGSRHLNRSGVVHGGVLSALIDIASSLSGCWTEDPRQRRRTMTLALTTNFTGQARGGVIRATGRVLASGDKIYTSAAEVRDAAGKLLAVGQGTFRYRSLPAPGAAIAA
ncbi:MAG TPA: PaaI family thioesterase [Burkholderiales bacterium]|jgi:uncharacterized protein (TIGR00369 family)|nr:PaaI family thioesterase [Burkholderiales bacterium]